MPHDLITPPELNGAQPPLLPAPIGAGGFGCSIGISAGAEGVRLEFGYSVDWLSFTAEQARVLASALVGHARLAERMR